MNFVRYISLLERQVKGERVGGGREMRKYSTTGWRYENLTAQITTHCYLNPKSMATKMS